MWALLVVVLAAMLAEPPVVVLALPVVLLVEAVPVDVSPALALFVVSLLAMEELLVEGVLLVVALLLAGVEAALTPSEPDVADEVSLEATDAFVEAVDVLLVADGEELLISELLAVLFVSLLATEALLVDGVVVLVEGVAVLLLLATSLLVLEVEGVAALVADELSEVLAWLLELLLAKPVEEEVEAVDDGEDAEVAEELVLAGCSLLAKPADVLAVDVDAVLDGADVDVDVVADGAEAEELLVSSLLATFELFEVLLLNEAVLLEDGEALADPEIFTFVFSLLLFAMLELDDGEVVDALGLLLKFEVLLEAAGELLLLLVDPEL